MWDYLISLFDNRTFGAQRSGQWSSVSKAYIEHHPQCEMGMHNPTLLNPLNVHHIQPFHEHPELELDKNNLIVLCRFHHFIHGHLKNWSRSNPQIRKDCKTLNDRIKNV